METDIEKTDRKKVLTIEGYGRRCRATFRLIERGLRLESIEQTDRHPVPLEWDYLANVNFPDEDAATRAICHSVLKGKVDVLDLIDISERAYQRWMDAVDETVLRWSIEKPFLKAEDIPVETASVLASGELKISVMLPDGDGVDLCLAPDEWKWRNTWQ